MSNSCPFQDHRPCRRTLGMRRNEFANSDREDKSDVCCIEATVLNVISDAHNMLDHSYVGVRQRSEAAAPIHGGPWTIAPSQWCERAEAIFEGCQFRDTSCKSPGHLENPGIISASRASHTCKQWSRHPSCSSLGDQSG